MTKQLFILLGKVSLTLALSSLLGLGMLLLLASSPYFEGLFMKVALASALGLGSGILARFILLQHTFLLRWVVAVLSLCAGLLLANVVSSGNAGFNPLQSFMVSVNWDGLWQIAMGSTIALLAILAWRRKPAEVPVSPEPVAASSLDDLALGPALVASPPQRVEGQPRPRKPVVNNRLGRPRKAAQPSGVRSTGKDRPRTNAPRSSTASKSASSTNHSGSRRSQASGERVNAGHRTGNGRKASASSSASGASAPPLKLESGHTAGARALKVPRARSKQISRPARSKTHSQRLRARVAAPIRLVGKEDHRCPYCLEQVDPRDPNGVVICEVCHTYHHKSCWDVTGTCQVPHLQRL